MKVHSGNKVIDCKTQGEWKIQSTMSINFMFSKDSEGTRTMHTKSHNVQIMIDNETNDIIKELFKSLLHRYEDFPAQQKHWKKFKLNNKIIALNILFVPYNAKEIILAYKSKQFKAWKSSSFVNDYWFVLWHYLAVKSLSVLLKGITSKHRGDYRRVLYIIITS